MLSPPSPTHISLISFHRPSGITSVDISRICSIPAQGDTVLFSTEIRQYCAVLYSTERYCSVWLNTVRCLEVLFRGGPYLAVHYRTSQYCSVWLGTVCTVYLEASPMSPAPDRRLTLLGVGDASIFSLLCGSECWFVLVDNVLMFY